MLETLRESWTASLVDLVRNAGQCLRICSPYVGIAPCTWLVENVPESRRASLQLDFLTNLSRDNLVSRATDVRGLIHLYDSFPLCEIRFLPHLHAKIYSSESLAIVTSANFTSSGFQRNLEYGVLINDPSQVQLIFDDSKSFHMIGSLVKRDELVSIDGIVEELSGLRTVMLNTVKKKTQEAFDKLYADATEQLLSIRARDIGAHAGFAESIRFILKRRGSASTLELYDAIKDIHTDLCDDSVKLVVSGVEWSQAKWKHRVRHAQQYLARKGEIVRKDNRWFLR